MVEKVRELMEKELHLLRELLSADVAALAWMQDRERRLDWAIASGCGDDRYRMLSIRIGRGLEGTVPRIGRPLVLDPCNPSASRMKEQSPFMLLEKLQTAAGLPVNVHGQLKGVLLAGFRSVRCFTPENLTVLQMSAKWLGQLGEYDSEGGKVHFGEIS
ncbi:MULTISPECIES: GAF domain-containing protein [Cohnella]|uniref:GAF domain-containing protein n=1 Tax=Cohnella TaxID=329857 RepID=UPI0009BC01C9|nr:MULTISPECIES: GAF domain-containing protein [Cohnella]MBN2981920.1 GAF domain-containing protein [Cohnella algarum]